MAEKPSYVTSTLAQLAVGSVGCYLLAALYISFMSKDISTLRWAAEAFGVAYLASRIPGAKKNGNSDEKPPEVKP